MTGSRTATERHGGAAPVGDNTAKARDFRREARTYKSALQQLVTDVEAIVRFIDDEMKKPSTHERGRRMAAITNSLEMAKDRAKLTLGTLKIHARKGQSRSQWESGEPA